MKITENSLILTMSLNKKLLRILGVIFALIVLFSLQALAQDMNSFPRLAPTPRPFKDKEKWKDKEKEAKDKDRQKERAKDRGNDRDIPVEKYIITDPKVRISLPCISADNVKINGWERSEIRISVNSGSGVGFKVAQRNEINKNPVWVMIVGYDSQEAEPSGAGGCISGNQVELDVPRNATIDLKGDEYNVNIESVYKAKVENSDGNISFSNISHGVEVKTYNGNVTVENSSGVMNLYSAAGNIIAFGTSSADIGDSFGVKTINGNITLQQIGQREIKAGTNSGSIRFNGNFDSGGQYSFGTTSGVINLLVPAEASFRVDASYGGAFRSDIPLKNMSKNNGGEIQKLTAIAGRGDANLSLITYSGAISIGKK